jgi:hypothetical protein
MNDESEHGFGEGSNEAESYLSFIVYVDPNVFLLILWQNSAECS